MKTTIAINGIDFQFDVSYRHYNKFMDGFMGGNAVQSAFNLLTKTVDKDQKEQLMEAITIEGQPKGNVVMDVAGNVSDMFDEADGGSVVKKR